MADTYPPFFVAGWRTLTNVCTYVLSRRRVLTLEGRASRGWYRNWSHDRRHRAELARPTSEDELVDLVRSHDHVRLVGAGHSFNDGLATDGVTISLDDLAGVIELDAATKRATVWAGTRLRDLTRALLAEGLAFRTLASHDAQSLGGVLSTDVHGTARGPAHFSDQVVALRLIDGNGDVHDVEPGDELFDAAVGGIGAVGVISRVTVQCVDAFDLRQAARVETHAWAEEHLDELLTRHDHASFYAYPFTDLMHVHTWDRTDERRSRLGATREALNEAKASISAAVVGDAMARFGWLPEHATGAMRTQRATELVLRSHEAFSRSLYHLHQEIEVAVPVESMWSDLRELLDLYETIYAEHRLPFLLIEVRFSPAGHDRSLLGAGVGRASAWLCVCCNQSGDLRRYFDAVEEWVRRSDARVHLGKWTEHLDHTDLARMHGDRFERFTRVRAAADPAGRFSNAFTDRVLGPVSADVPGG